MQCDSLASAEQSSDFSGTCFNCSSLTQLWNTTTAGLELTGVWYWAVAPQAGKNLFFIQTGVIPEPSGNSLSTAQTACQLRNASYNVEFEFSNGIQSTIIQKLELESSLDFNSSSLVSRLPINGGQAYLSMFLALTNLLSGTVGGQDGASSAGLLGGGLPVLNTGIMACPEVIQGWMNFPDQDVPPLNETTFPWMCRNGSVAKAVEDLANNFTLSLMSSSIFSTNISTDVQLYFPQNFWHYQPRDLVIAYVAGVAVTLFCVIIGTWACVRNRCTASSSFSTIMLTTRNSRLDTLVNDHDLDLKSHNKALEAYQLQYGIVHEHGTDHPAFGTTDQIEALNNARRAS